MSGFGPDRCLWCLGAEGPLKTIREVTPDRFGLNPTEREYTVHPHHEVDTREFLRSVRENARFFLGTMLAFTAAGTALAAIAVGVAQGGGDEERWAAVLFGPYTLALGLFVVRYPYATPETVKWLGLRRARTVARWCGWITAGLGVWIVSLGF